MEKSLAKIIKNARESKGISQRKLSRQIGIDHNNISDIETGKRKKPNVLIIKKIAIALDIDFKLLLLSCGYSENDIKLINQN